ncbi:hypothetical protein E4U21_002646 [Claviceps maximensis]|nr:hypothetical protein E4U21_002646 [Claviceps maximensis]
MSSSRIVRSFRTLPTMLFRLSNGGGIRLRDRALGKRKSFDVVSRNGIVYPRGSAARYGPNGASMRPLAKAQIELVKQYVGPNIIVYQVPENTILPDNLVLFDEGNNHFSMQPAKPMTVEELNVALTNFFEENGKKYTKEQWLLIHSQGWQWSDKDQNYFRSLKDGSREWYNS